MNCGRPDCTGSHGHRRRAELCPAAREKERAYDALRRRKPHVCRVRGCTRPALEWWTGGVDERCWFHKERHDFMTYSNRLERQWAEAEGRVWEGPWKRDPDDPPIRFEVVRRWSVGED